MKPRFSLSLSHEGIGLLHRTKNGWSKVGDVALDDPDLAQSLRMMRDTASALEGGGILTKLVLPDSQILYTTILLEDGDPVEHIRTALEGLTPYARDEIAFDWERHGDSALVAAVALETLSEAEAFAVEHRFNPVYFTATPSPDQFPREPWFGETFAAVKLLPEHETLEPDEADQPVIGASLDTEKQPERPSEPAAAAAPPLPPETPPAADRPAASAIPMFETGRSSPAASAPETAVPAPTAEQRLHFEAASTPAPEMPDLADRNLGITAAEAPELAGPKPKAKRKPAAKSRARPGRKAKSEKAAPAAAAVQVPAATPVVPEPSIGALEAAATLNTPAPPKGFALFGSQDAPPKRPALGLLLTAALVVVMLLIAAWTLMAPGGDETRSAAAKISDAAAPVETANLDVPEQPEAPEIAALSQPEAMDLDLQTEEMDVAPEELAAEPEAPPAPFTPTQARAYYASKGIWALAPASPQAPATDTLRDLYVASLDPQVTAQDAIALPPATSGTPLGSTSAPATAGDRFSFDALGLVKPSPNGTRNPDGVLIYAGKPDIVPPARPARPDAETEAEATQTAQQLAEENPLQGFRPQARPTDLAESNERANLGGLSRAELAQIRAKARPRSAQEQAAAASLADLNEPEAREDEDAPTQITSASTLAIASSRSPKARPRNFANTVKKAQSELTRSAAVAVPTSAKMKPSAPSAASVAKQATLPNAINLRKTNLIGVYGSNSERRALVRLKSGRYLKVKVGDRVDGGRVTAITESELRYKKGSRNVVLKLPRG